MKKIEIVKNKRVSLGISMLILSKILMFKFCYDYITPKYDKKAKLLYGHRQFD